MTVEGQDQFLMVVSLRWVLEPTVISKSLKSFIEFAQSPRAHNVGFDRVVSADIEFNYATAGHTIPDPSVLVCRYRYRCRFHDFKLRLVPAPVSLEADWVFLQLPPVAALPYPTLYVHVPRTFLSFDRTMERESADRPSNSHSTS